VKEVSEKDEIEELRFEITKALGVRDKRIAELEKNSLPKAIYEGLIRDHGNKINELIDEIANLKEKVK